MSSEGDRGRGRRTWSTAVCSGALAVAVVLAGVLSGPVDTADARSPKAKGKHPRNAAATQAPSASPAAPADSPVPSVIPCDLPVAGQTPELSLASPSAVPSAATSSAAPSADAGSSPAVPPTAEGSPGPSPSPAPSIDPGSSPASSPAGPAVSPDPCPVAQETGSIPSPSPDTGKQAARHVKAVKPGPVESVLNVPISRRLPCFEFSRGCVNRVDIYHPANAGSWPTVVTIHGRPRTPADMRELAIELAKRGAVVFNADYRGVRPVSKGFPESIQDVACAIRYARAHTKKYGGDPDHIVLVGHSYGGYVGMMVSVAGNRFPGRKGDCLVEKGSSLPDGFAHVAGVSITKASEPLDVLYFGGPKSAIPKVWLRGDVFHQVALKGNHDLQVGIIFELHDPFLGYGHATWLQDALKKARYHSRMVLLDEGHTHFDVLDMDTALGRRVLAFVRGVIARSKP